MPSRFDQEAQQVFADMTGHAGEPVRILPRVSAPSRAPLADGSRVAGTIVGIFREAPSEIMLEGSRRGGDGRGTTTFAAVTPTVWLSKAMLIVLGWQPRDGDAVILLDRGAATYAVEKADPSDLGDVTLHLTSERGPV